MRKSPFQLSIVAIGIISLGLCFIAPSLCSAAPSSSNAIRISPALSNIKLAPNETSTSIVMDVSNLATVPLNLKLSMQDFEASQTQSDIISFYGATYNPYTNLHGLQTAVSFSPAQVTLSPRASQKVTVSLDNLGRLAAGGHYGAVLFSPTAVGSSKAGATKVSISSAAASLIFLQTATGGTQALNLLSFSTGRLEFSMPTTTYIAFQNVGNTQTAPQGQVTLYGSGGKLLSTTVLNAGSGLVLPNSSRPYTVSLPIVRTHFTWIGIYRLELKYRSSPQGSFTTVSKRFFYVNLRVLSLVIVLFLGLYSLLRKYGKRLFTRFLGLVQLRKKKPTPPPQQPKSKKPRPLIQG